MTKDNRIDLACFAARSLRSPAKKDEWEIDFSRGQLMYRELPTFTIDLTVQFETYKVTANTDDS